MSRKALLAELFERNPRLESEMAKVTVAANLTLLVAHSGISRTALAEKLGWSRARVSQVLSGQGNLTIETMHAIAQAAGSNFEVVFRQYSSTPAFMEVQPRQSMQLKMVVNNDLTDWMSRKTMQDVLGTNPKQKPFSGAQEIASQHMTLDASNHDWMRPEVACAA